MKEILRFPFSYFVTGALSLGILQAQSNWTLTQTNGSPPARASRGMLAYNEALQRFVLFGGDPISGPNFLGDTWLYDPSSSTWTAGPPGGPTPRSWHSLNYDVARQHVVLFGGRVNTGNGTLSNQTWAFNGTWSPLTPQGSSPPGRWAHAAAFDSGRSVLVIFGGQGNGGYLADTWEWNGTTWTPLAPVFSPSARRNASMAYDSARARTVLFGGVNSSGGYLNGTFEWDGSNWVDVTPPPGFRPGQRAQGAMDYDEAQARVILHSGYGATGANFQDTWSWDGTTWTQVFPATSPAPRAGASAAYDVDRRRIVMFGGADATAAFAETWYYASPAPADFVVFGANCASPTSSPQLSLNDHRLPWVNDSFAIRIDGMTMQPKLLVLAAGLSASSWMGIPLPINLGLIGMPGCSLLVSGDATSPYLVTDTLIETVVVPNIAALASATVFYQGFVLDPAAGNSFGALVTNGGQAIIGLR